MISHLIDIVLLTMLVATAIALVRMRSLFAVIMLAGIYSLLSAGIFVTLDAVDVAFTEAAVGAGISTVLLLGTLALVGHRQARPRHSPLLPLTVVSVIGVVLIWGTADMPRFGDPGAPIHQHVAPRYIQDSPQEIGVPNMVTSVLASYRGFDTLGETLVVFTAGIGVLALLRRRRGTRSETAGLQDRAAAINKDPMLAAVAKLLIPYILLFALYVQFHGDFGPGGGFQAGVIFAAGIILYALLNGFETATRLVAPRALPFIAAFGVLLYGGVGVASMLLGGEFLNYNLLAHDPVHGQHYGILVIELGVGITVTAVMLSIFFAFMERAQRTD